MRRVRDPGVLISNMIHGFGELPPKSKPHPTVCLELSGIRVEARSWLVWEAGSTPRVCDLPPHSLGHSGGSTRPAPPCSTKDLEKGAGRCLGLEVGPDPLLWLLSWGKNWVTRGDLKRTALVD